VRLPECSGIGSGLAEPGYRSLDFANKIHNISMAWLDAGFPHTIADPATMFII
jgi:hypothetical protein